MVPYLAIGSQLYDTWQAVSLSAVPLHLKPIQQEAMHGLPSVDILVQVST